MDAFDESTKKQKINNKQTTNQKIQIPKTIKFLLFGN
jgi:hypothetical protein